MSLTKEDVSAVNVVSMNKIYIYMLLGEERHCENDTSCFSKSGLDLNSTLLHQPLSQCTYLVTEY